MAETTSTPAPPEVVWLGGGADRIQLTDDPDDTYYYPGDTVPLDEVQRGALSRSGHRFATRHDDGTLTPFGATRPPEIDQAVAERRAAESAYRAEAEQRLVAASGGPTVAPPPPAPVVEPTPAPETTPEEAT